MVAKGFGQVYGENYTETFSPVMLISTIRIILALSVELDLKVHQIDISSAYLNSTLHDEVFMFQPEGFKDKTNRVLKLKKALYGLKQSGREWNEKLDSILKTFGMMKCDSDSCVYMKGSGKSLLIIGVYVDDILLASFDDTGLERCKEFISKNFKLVDKGSVNHFLGLEVERNQSEIKIGQKQFILDLLKQFNMNDCRKGLTPLDPGLQLKCTNEECVRSDKTLYQSLIGSLLYLAKCTRPDLLHTVIKLASHNSDPHVEHFTNAKGVLRYLSNTVNVKLVYRKTKQELCCFTDADWGGDSTDRKSYTGYVFILAGSAVAWESKKQPTVALSSTEAEYMSLCSASKETIYLRKLLQEIGLAYYVRSPTVIFSDNLSSHHLVRNPVFHAGSKHIDIKHHFTREAFQNGYIDLKFVSTDEMTADILTKNLQKNKHIKFLKKMGLKFENEDRAEGKC